MAFQGEYFVDRYGKKAAEQTPPIRLMQSAGLPVGAGTDATRVRSYNPFVALHWLITGKTVGGLKLYDSNNCQSRLEALNLYTKGSAWFSGDVGKKGSLLPGQFADLAVLSEDYFTIDEDSISKLESLLTVVGGKIVYGQKEFAELAPPPLPHSPVWSPASRFGGYAGRADLEDAITKRVQISALATGSEHTVQNCSAGLPSNMGQTARKSSKQSNHLWGDLGCNCWAY